MLTVTTYPTEQNNVFPSPPEFCLGPKGWTPSEPQAGLERTWKANESDFKRKQRSERRVSSTTYTCQSQFQLTFLSTKRLICNYRPSKSFWLFNIYFILNDFFYQTFFFISNHLKMPKRWNFKDTCTACANQKGGCVGTGLPLEHSNIQNPHSQGTWYRLCNTPPFGKKWICLTNVSSFTVVH